MHTRTLPAGRAGLILGALSALALALGACAPQTPTSRPATPKPSPVPPTAPAATQAPAPVAGEPTVLPSGLQYIEVEKGQGAAAEPGMVVSVHYRGTLEDGTEFDSSYKRGQPISFPLGRGRVIAGWEEGIALMKVGGKARLIIPPALGYGEKGAGATIPPNATLIFDVELVDASPGSPDAPQAVAEADYTTTPSGLKYYDLAVGDGAAPKAGQQVSVHYTGWLLNGTKFDSSLDRGEPFTFTLGARQVIAGWDEGLSTMKVGGQRQLVLPPALAYGESGAGGVIPPNATLIFEVELLGVQ